MLQRSCEIRFLGFSLKPRAGHGNRVECDARLTRLTNLMHAVEQQPFARRIWFSCELAKRPNNRMLTIGDRFHS